jgi:hypothetical protein
LALVTAAEVGPYLPGVAAGNADLGVGAIVELLIARADATLAQWCGYEPATEGGAGVPTLEDTTYTKFLPGSGSRTLQLPFYPIVSVTTIEDDTTEAFDGSSYLIAGTEFDIRKDKGLLVLKQTAAHGIWYSPTTEGMENIKAVWVAGWAAVPADMKQAVIQLVTYWYNQKGTLGKQTVTGQGFALTPRDETIPLPVRQLMAPYRLLRAWA